MYLMLFLIFNKVTSIISATNKFNVLSYPIWGENKRTNLGAIDLKGLWFNTEQTNDAGMIRKQSS